MSGLLVLGALHHDVVVDAPRLPRLDETVVGSAVDYRFGGKGGNQALAAARMGADVQMAGRVGDDAAGRGILAVLDKAGVDRGAVQVGKAASGMSVAITDDAGGYGAVIVSGANLENDGQVVLDVMPQIVLIQNEIPEAANRNFVAGLAGDTVLIWNAAPARDWDEVLGDRTDLLIVNRLEAADLTGQSNPEAAAEALHARVRGSVIVTLGADGALATQDAESGTAPFVDVAGFPAMTVHPISTHGAGDMFAGALAARLLVGEDLVLAVALAQIAAGLFVASPIEERGSVTLDAALAQMP